MEELKSGKSSTELYFNVLVAILGVLVAAGIIDPDTQANISSGLKEIIGGVMIIVSSINYTVSRHRLKKAAMENKAAIEIARIDGE